MAKVQLEDVERAVGELETEGKAVSVAAVRLHLGRGSDSTITPLLRQVREKRQRVGELPSELDENAPPAELVAKLTDTAAAAAAAMFRSLAGSLNGSIQAARAELEADREAMRRENDQVIAEANEARDAATDLQQRLEAALTRNAELVGEMQAAAAARLQRDADIEAARQQRDADIEAERQRAAENIDRMRADLSARDAELLELRGRFESLLSESSELRGRLAASQKPARSGGGGAKRR